MTKRTWRFMANFHRVGEVTVIVTAPNWQGAVRKACLEVKKLPTMKGRRLTAGAFTVQEIEPIVQPATPAEQLTMGVGAANQAANAEPLAQTGEAEQPAGQGGQTPEPTG